MGGHACRARPGRRRRVGRLRRRGGLGAARGRLRRTRRGPARRQHGCRSAPGCPSSAALECSVGDRPARPRRRRAVGRRARPPGGRGDPGRDRGRRRTHGRDGPDGRDARRREGAALLIDFDSRRREPWSRSTWPTTRCWSPTPGSATPSPTAGTAPGAADCESAARALGVPTLRHATLDAVEALADDRVRRRARHVVTEIAAGHRHAWPRWARGGWDERRPAVRRLAPLDARRLRDLLPRARLRRGDRRPGRGGRGPDDRRRVRRVQRRGGARRAGRGGDPGRGRGVRAGGVPLARSPARGPLRRRLASSEVESAYSAGLRYADRCGRPGLAARVRA